MQTNQKITKLLSQNYMPNISILGNYLSNRFTSILDIDNGTNFIVSDNLLFSFKDHNNNCWLTVVESFHKNGKEYFPTVGDLYTFENGKKYNFTTKEEIVEMAIAYFSKHIAII